MYFVCGFNRGQFCFFWVFVLGFRVDWWAGWVSGLAGGFVLYLLWVFGFRDFLRGGGI